MSETHTAERKMARSRGTQPFTVSANALAKHLDCSRAYIQKLEADGIVCRDGDGFPLDASRVSYLRHLRRERKQSPRGEADTAFTQAKAQLINMRIAEKKRDLIPYSKATETAETLIGIVLTKMSGMAARCAGHDLQLRRRIDQVVYETRVEMAEAFNAMADKKGEPVEDDSA